MPIPMTVGDVLPNPLRIGCPQEWGLWYQPKGDELMDGAGRGEGRMTGTATVAM